MAGSSSDFDASSVRASLRAVMKVAAPVNPADRVTFRWTPVSTAAGPADPSGIPYDLSSDPTSTTRKPDVQVPCAVRYTKGQMGDTPVGEFDTTRPVLTILDEDYAQVKGADRVLIGGTAFRVDYVAPPEALYDLGVFTVYLVADTAGDHKLTRS